VWRLWGDGWVIRQAVALTPAAVDLTAVATSVADQEPALAAVVRREADFRAYRGDLGWWRQDWDTVETDLHRRSWLFSVLTAAHTPVVLDLAADIDVATSALTPKHYRSLEAAVTVFVRSALKRQLSLREPLRLGRITYSARTLWLLGPLVTENSAEQVAKKLRAGFEDLLLPGMGDRRFVLRTIGRQDGPDRHAARHPRHPPGRRVGRRRQAGRHEQGDRNRHPESPQPVARRHRGPRDPAHGQGDEQNARGRLVGSVQPMIPQHLTLRTPPQEGSASPCPPWEGVKPKTSAPAALSRSDGRLLTAEISRRAASRSWSP